MDVDTRKVYHVRINCTVRHNLFNLCDADLPTLRQIRVEVSGCLPEKEVTSLISLPSSDKGKVSDYGAFSQVVNSVKCSACFLFGRNCRPAKLTKFDRYATLFDKSVDPSSCIKSRNASATSTTLFNEGALWHELDLNLTIEEFVLDVVVLTKVRGNDSPYLVVLHIEANSEVDEAAIVRY